MQSGRQDGLADRRYFAGPFVLWITGALALTPGVEVLKHLVMMAAPGWDLPVGPRLNWPLVTFALLFLLLARIGFSQRRHQRFLRRHPDMGARVFLGLGQILVTLIVFMTALAMIRMAHEEALVPVFIFLGFPIVLGMMVFAFFFPGRYAAALAERHARRSGDGNTRGDG